ncbi:unnamed protein product [Sphagnum compactum]
MVWCSYCGKDQIAERDEINGFTCCTGCGRVLDDNVYSTDVTFTKGADGSSQAEGNFVRDGQTSLLRIGGAQGRVLGFQSDSHEKTLNKGKYEIQEIAERLSIKPREDMVRAAHRFYTIAVERNFTRGRLTQRVAGACLYIVCRQENHPYMLIDFSDCLQTNVYVLGAVFLQLCQLLRLEQHPIMQKPVDPSLFIHRFADRLNFGKKFHVVANCALRLVASMKRDWMQTGRRPSGICGAALFIAAHVHGFERSKADVVGVVHVCEATLKKRLVEFESTESGSLTTEEFDAKAKEIDLQIRVGLVSPQIEGKGMSEIMCEHKVMGAVHFAHGLCRGCYDEFVKVSGGMQGGSAPPAFQRAEQQRLEEKKKAMIAQGVVFNDDEDPAHGTLSITQKALKRKTGVGSQGRGQGRGRGRGRGSVKQIEECKGGEGNDRNGEGANSGEAEGDDADTTGVEEEEVNGYLHNEEEVRLKTIIWTEMNKEYLEEQSAKQAAIAASEAARVAAFAAAATNSASAADLAAAAAAAVAKLKKERKQKRAEDAKRPPPETAADATCQMLVSKRFSSKVNYTALAKLFDGGAVSNDVTALKDGNEDNIEAEPTKADVGEVDAGDMAEDDDYEEAAVYGNDEAQDYLQVEGLSPFGLQDMDAEEEYYDEY